jgi:hypothetical protein
MLSIRSDFLDPKMTMKHPAMDKRSKQMRKAYNLEGLQYCRLKSYVILGETAIEKEVL